MSNQHCITCGQVIPEKIKYSMCAICASQIDSNLIVHVEGLGVCRRCSLKPNVKQEAKEHKAKAEAEAASLRRRIQFDRDNQEAEEYHTRTTIRDNHHCYEDGNLYPPSELTLLNGRYYCKLHLKPENRSAQGLIHKGA